jgi:protein ImuB
MRSIVVVHPGWHAGHGAHGAEHEYRTYEPVVRAVGTVSPLVEVTEPGCLVFLSRGPSRYFGGERAVVGRVHSLVAGTGLGGFGVGAADSRFAAMAAAHMAAARARPCIIDPSVAQEFVGALPVAALHRLGGIPEDVVDLFLRLGLRTCGAVAALGERALIERFGLDGRHAHRLVTGTEVRLLDPGAPPPDIVRAVDFDTPLPDVRHVVGAARACIDDALGAVSRTGRQCVRVLVSCETDHAETSERIWAEPRGFTPATVAQRLSWQLEGWLAPAGGDPAEDAAASSGVVRVVVTPLECRDVLVDQPLLWGGHRENAERASRAVGMAVATGAGVTVTVPQWNGGRDASGEYGRIPVDMVDLCDAAAAEQRVQEGRGVPRDWRGALPAPSPTVVHPQPPPVRVVDAHGTEVSVTGRHELSAGPAHVTVGRHGFTVLRHAGPWPVEERWWDHVRRRRLARVQVLVREDRTGLERVLLLGLENGAWSLLARYD